MSNLRAVWIRYIEQTPETLVAEFPETRDSLIVQVKDPSNRMAWEEFAQVYRPIIYRIARTRGMQEADAQDLAQQVLMAVASAIGRWERSDEGTRFRNWLSRITRNAIVKALTRRPKDRAVGGMLSLDLFEEASVVDPETTELIALEYRRELYLRASAIIRRDVNPETWQAFEMTVLHSVSIEDTAAKLNKSKGSVYAARSRIMLRLREAIHDLEESSQ